MYIRTDSKLIRFVVLVAGEPIILKRIMLIMECIINLPERNVDNQEDIVKCTGCIMYRNEEREPLYCNGCLRHPTHRTKDLPLYIKTRLTDKWTDDISTI